MDSPAAANVFGTLGAVLWSLQLLPQIWKNWRRHDTQSLSSTFFLSWAVAGVPLGVYNIADDFNIALQIQPNILIFLSLWTWFQCKYYGDKWGTRKIVASVTGIAIVLAGAEVGLVYALRLARERGHTWPSILMAIVAAILLAGGVLRHYLQMLKTRSDAGLSLKFATLDLSGDVASLLSVLFQKTLKIYGIVIYGSELAIWVGLIGLAIHYRRVRNAESSKGPVTDMVVSGREENQASGRDEENQAF
ncbi:pq loop repeat protein [Colletotrichum scovillei]|uniref:Pq loop repeat protein n=1 Tax=Colletotrichum scovillei TaxID=1209932 RepID=A0A9P7QVQ4_9PEZI|nr:pq loop repeat protein [Colletotrichum scovillei]KAG7049052.1 pq loop repeat protein [Colletotrichum scovillei]KAG7063797.1 pq loop repeat protein [Colletotrichum scovillei]